jgi:plasmid stabilization system protein ParE
LRRCAGSCATQLLRALLPHEGGDYGGGYNPTRAVSFSEELLDSLQALADTPRAYPLVQRYEGFGIRRCVHGDYLIFYRLQPEQIEVSHILQGARDIEALLFGPL